MLSNILENPAEPIHWGKNQAGMQAKEELDELTKAGVKSDWNAAMQHASFFAQYASLRGAHKQIANRLTEPFQMVKMVISATELQNFFWLRLHADAQPEIQELARKMKLAYDASEAVELQDGEWHVPYVDRYTTEDGSKLLYFSNNKEVSIQEALRISASMCAQVSYRKSDDSQEKADKIFKQLIETEPCHASPVEHQAMALHVEPTKLYSWQWPEGVTHVDRKGQWWSGNFCGFVQHRQLIPNHSKEG